jgi:four helix bundle protein
MATIKRFEDLESWQKARILAREMYAISDLRAISRDWALLNQIRSASLSPMSNIAEGFGRRTDKEFIAFLSNAHGSVAECQSLMYVLLDRHVIDGKQFEALYRLANSVSRLIQALANYLARPTKRESEKQTPRPLDP